nr:hypothetical protein [Tanacetum cinerariifolium]
MHFLLTTLKAVYVLSTPSTVWSENKTLETTRKRMKWEDDNYICRGHILNGMSDSLFDIYQNAKSAKALRESLESKYMTEDASATKFLEKTKLDHLPSTWLKEMEPKVPITVRTKESSKVVMINLPNKKGTVTCWKCKKTGHMKKDCRSCKGNDGAGSNGSKDPEKQHGHNKYVITFIDNAFIYCYVYLLHAKHEALDKFKIYKQEVELQRQDLIKVLRTDRGGEYYDPVYFQSTGIIHQTTAPYTPQQNGVAERKNMTLKEMVNSMLSYSGLTVVRLTELKMKNLGGKDIDCIFIGYAEHSKCYRFYVIKPNDYVSVNSIIESRDVIFDEERFTSVPRPRGMIQPYSSKIIEDEVEGTDDVPSPSVPRKSTRTRKAKSFGSDFQLYLVEGTRDKTLSQCEYCFIIEEDPRTLSEAMASRDVAFWKESVQRCKWILKRKMKVDENIDKYKARLVIQGFRENERIDFFDTYAPVARISTIRLLLALATIHDLVIHQMDVKTAFLNGDLDEEIYMKQPEGFVMPEHERKLEYSRAIGCLIYAMINTRPYIAFVVGKLSRYTSNPSALHWQALEGYSDDSWINNMEDHSSTSGWVFLLEGGAISWASKKQTCITSSTMESEFVALAAASNEAEWLRNLVYEILLWHKAISTISIRCYSAATLAKAYSQVYNDKYRHLGVRHSMIRVLIMNGVISVEFLRTQLNLADHLTKGLARDLVRKVAIRMGLKST